MGINPINPTKSILNWVKRGGFAVLDQGLFASANFLMNILLARWLPPEQYGAFAVAYSVFLLLATFHTAVLTEPMLVFGAGKYQEKFKKYLGFLLYGHWGLTALVSLILGVITLVFWRLGSVAMAQALSGLAIAAPFILLLWLLRRAFYVHLQPQWAATGGGLYIGLMLAGMYGLYREHWLSSFTALMVMGVASIGVGFWLTSLLRPQWVMVGNPTPAMVAGDHWRYGRWSLGIAGLTWIPGNIYFVILPAWIGLDGIAALRALMNLVMPVLHAISAISLLLLPLLSRNLREGIIKMVRTMKLFLVLFITGAGLYLLGLVVFRVKVLSLLYGSKYIEFSSLVPLIGLLPLCASVTVVFGVALRVMERPDRVFWCYVASSAVALIGGVILVQTLGISGAIWGFIFSSLTTGILMIAFYNQLSRQWKEV